MAQPPRPGMGGQGGFGNPLQNQGQGWSAPAPMSMGNGPPPGVRGQGPPGKFNSDYLWNKKEF